MVGMTQMSLLQDLPFSLCEPGPEKVDGVGNYYLQIFAKSESLLPLSTLYFLDSHGQIPSKVKDPDYDWIKQSQIDWFTRTSQALRRTREKHDSNDHFHLSLAFMHIPLPEYGGNDLIIKGGQRREPTEGPSFNSHFYNALIKEGISAVGCGHDHVNDFCALRPDEMHEESQQYPLQHPRLGPWLCYGGGSGFGGYCSYDGKRYHRRSRVWELDTKTGGIKTWKRVEYARERVDELVLVEGGEVTPGSHQVDGRMDSRTESLMEKYSLRWKVNSNLREAIFEDSGHDPATSILYNLTYGNTSTKLAASEIVALIGNIEDPEIVFLSLSSQIIFLASEYPFLQSQLVDLIDTILSHPSLPEIPQSQLRSHLVATIGDTAASNYAQLFEKHKRTKDLVDDHINLHGFLARLLSVGGLVEVNDSLYMFSVGLEDHSESHNDPDIDVRAAAQYAIHAAVPIFAGCVTGWALLSYYSITFAGP